MTKSPTSELISDNTASKSRPSTEGTAHRVCSIDDLPEGRAKGIKINGHHIAVFNDEGEFHAVDNRCPHMGYPLVKGTINDGILICHWHHWEFDLKTGACFAGHGDDVKTFPVTVDNGDIFIHLSADNDQEAYRRLKARGITSLNQGLKDGSTFIVAKAIAALSAAGATTSEIVSRGLLFGSRKSTGGWSGGMVVLTIAANMWDDVNGDDRNLFLVHGLARIGGQSSSRPLQFSFPGTDDLDVVTLKRWFRRFVEQRNRTGAERILLTLHAHNQPKYVLADFIFTSATDFYYTGRGHALDFGNKALEALDHIDGNEAGELLRPIVVDLATRTRHEEDAQWADAVPVLDDIFTRLDEIWDQNQSNTASLDISTCAQMLLGNDFHDIVAQIESQLRSGVDPQDLCRALTYASAIRTAHFHLKNEGDWHAVANLYSYAHALYCAFKLAPSKELLRGIFHGSVECTHLRWLNMPSARIPKPADTLDDLPSDPDTMLARLQDYADFQKVYQAELVVNQYIAEGHDIVPLRRQLAHILLQEDAELHMFQVLEAASRHYDVSNDDNEKRIHLLAATRYITAQKARKGVLWATKNAEMLQRGDRLSEREDND